MNIVEIQHIGFPAVYYNYDSGWHFDYKTAYVPRGTTVDAHIYLTIFSPGVWFYEFTPCQFSRTAGSAVAGIAGYKYIDENGIVQEVVYDVQVKLLTSLHVEKCVEITFVLISRFCNAKADGLIFHWQ